MLPPEARDAAELKARKTEILAHLKLIQRVTEESMVRGSRLKEVEEARRRVATSRA